MQKLFVMTLTLAVWMAGVATANQFAQKMCQSTLPENWRCVQVQPGATWGELIPDAEYRKTIQKFNRQNLGLLAGQWLVVPPSYLQWNQLAPFAVRNYADQVDVIVFDPVKLAWAHYLNGQLATWGPAVGGKDWCPDVGRACRTDVGDFSFSEAAGPNRRSSAYPRGCSGRGCARMPYFTRFTAGGQGIHKRNMRGANASHGCIGVFADDAVYINSHVRARIGKKDYGYFTTIERANSAASTQFIVLSYATSENTS